MTAIHNIDGIRGPVPPPTGDIAHTQAQDRAPEDSNPTRPTTAGATASSGELQDLAAELETKLDLLGQGHTVALRWDEERNGPIVQVLNKDGEVLNQFPPEKILNLRRVLDELSGMVINRTT